MDKSLLYTSGKLYEGKQTGGIKRLCALSEYAFHNCNYDICCGDSKETLKRKNLTARYHVNSDVRKKFLPPEAGILIGNSKVIKSIRNAKYQHVIVFDVPQAIGLCLFGIKNICLMIRKDMIGYEIVTHKKGIKLALKVGFQWMCESICLIKAQKVICQCTYDKEKLIKRHLLLKRGIERKTKIQINNVNPPWITKKSSIKSNCIDVDTSKYNICFVGNFDDERKGHNYILEAANIVIRNNSNTCFHIIGGGNELDTYKNKYNNPQIIFYGNLDNPLPLVKQCDLVVVPSLADSCPNTVMEALYNDVLVIGSNRGGIPEILINKSLLFELDVHSIVALIEKVCNNVELSESLKEIEHNRKMELSFNWAERILSIIKEEN